MKKLLFVPALAVSLFLASCGGGNESSNETTGDTTTGPQTEATAPSATEKPGADIPGIDTVSVTDHIVLDGDDQMQYDKHLFKVKAGQKITLSFKNIGKLPATAMSHNVVILAQGTDMEAFGTAAVKAAKPDHLPAEYMPDIISHTKMLGPGESDEITFTLPDAGVYTYLCTFPGHFATMHGKIVAE